MIQDGRIASSSVATVAVFCQQIRGGLHVGFLYEADDKTVMQCHLAWDRDCRKEKAAIHDKYWVDINAHQENLNFIANALDLMDQNHNQVRYSVLYEGKGDFDPTNFSYKQESPGLTCATFIDAVLRSCRLELFDVLSWPCREEDHDRIEKLINMLQDKPGMEASSIDNMRRNHNNRRIRPEETCGAVSISEDTWPVPFKRAEELGKVVKEHICGQQPADAPLPP